MEPEGKAVIVSHMEGKRHGLLMQMTIQRYDMGINSLVPGSIAIKWALAQVMARHNIIRTNDEISY